eukprot:TCONS_00009930-protein
MVLSTLRGVLTKRPLLRSIVTVTSLFAASDLCCQLFENHGNIKYKFDWERLRKMATIGLIYYGPMYYYYYGFLDRKFPGKNPRTVLVKILFDQFIFAVPSQFFFYCIAGKLERKNNSEIIEEIKLKYIPTYVTSTIFWPAAQLVNFSLVPPTHRILFVSSANFVWLNILSYIKNRPNLPAVLERVQNWTTMDVKKELVVEHLESENNNDLDLEEDPESEKKKTE